MKKAFRSVVLICLACCLLLSGTASGMNGSDVRSTAAIISDMISAYGSSCDPSDPVVAELTDELRAQDTVLADLWSDIITYWDELNRTFTLSPERLPDGLPRDNSLCIIVLGYALQPDGKMRPELIGRLETVLTCARQYPDAYVLCTGGGTASGCPEITEAGSMGEWLLQHGLEPERLIIENRSLSTAENAFLSSELLYAGYPQVRTAAIVSSDYHIPWAQLLFEAVFMKNTALNGVPRLYTVANAAYITGRQTNADVTVTQITSLRRLIDR